MRWVFYFQNNLKNLDPSYKMDLDFWDCIKMDLDFGIVLRWI